VQLAKRLPTPLPDQSRPDVRRITEVLDRHGVDYLVIGGVATQAYGAERPTGDFDCVVRRTGENFDRLAAAMRELKARLRVEGLRDEESAALPVQLDGLMLSRSQISTWATDAGHLDVLVDMVNRQGHRQRYEELEGAAEELTVAGIKVRVAGLDDIIASKEYAGRPKDNEALAELYRLRDRSTDDWTPSE
jgi:hypothetical protein